MGTWPALVAMTEIGLEVNSRTTRTPQFSHCFHANIVLGFGPRKLERTVIAEREGARELFRESSPEGFLTAYCANTVQPIAHSPADPNSPHVKQGRIDRPTKGDSWRSSTAQPESSSPSPDISGTLGKYLYCKLGIFALAVAIATFGPRVATAVILATI